MPNQDKTAGSGFNVEVIPVAASATNGQISIPSASQIGSGLAVIPLPQYAQGMPSTAPAGPSVILIAFGQGRSEEDDERRRKDKEKEKEEKEKREKEKKTSSVFYRL